MSTPKKQKVWMVLDHPQQFAIALGIISHWSREKFIFNLLISSHPYWRKVDINLYKEQFDKIYFFERPDYLPSHAPQIISRFVNLKKRIARPKTKRTEIINSQSIFNSFMEFILNYVIHVPQMISQIFRLKKKIAQLGIQQNDIIVGLSIFHYLENVVLSVHPQNLKIAIMPKVVYAQCTRFMNKKIYRNTLEGWLANWFVEPITGLHRTYCMKERLHPDTYWWIRYRESLLDIFDKVIVLGDFPSETSYFGDNIFTMPFPYILAFEKAGAKNNYRDKKAQKIVFFGTPFREGLWNITPEIYAKNLNACLSFLREKYGATYKLVYRPHPMETYEIKLLDLDQFEIANDGMLAELYFYRNVEDIYAAFSVESTSSRSAFDFFINAYAFLNIFPYDEVVKKYFRLEMGNVSDDFYINDLSTTPNRYIKFENVNAAIKKCHDVLDTILVK